jgi:hypothetical protein
VDSIQTKVGGFVFVLATAFGAAALLYFGGKWIVIRFSDPKWLKRYVPLFAFVFVTLKVFVIVVKLLDRSISNQFDGFLFAGYSLFIAACVGAWRRYLFAHPDGPPEAPPPPAASNPAISTDTRSED